MRVAALHLVADRGYDIGQGKVTGFLSHARMKHDLEQQVAKLLLEIGHVGARDRVGDFIGFLDRIRSDAREILCDIPFATRGWIAESRHYCNQTVNHRERAAGMDITASPIICIMLNILLFMRSYPRQDRRHQMHPATA